MAKDKTASSEFPFVQSPKAWAKSVWIEHEKGSHTWMASGDSPSFRQWLNELHDELGGDLIPMTWAAEYVGVSRESVTRRVEANMLTCFSFLLEGMSKSLFGRKRKTTTRQRYDYVTRSECSAWRDIVSERYNVDLSPKKGG